MFRAFVSVTVIFLFAHIHMISGECSKHEALLHNFRPMYYIDQRETIQLWAKVIPERWQDNRLIGSLSNTDYLAFNLTSWETSSETQGIGVTTRDVNAIIRLKNKLPGNINRLSESPVEVSFAIKTFSEDSTCSTLKAETTVTVGCPPFRRIFPRGKPSSCDGFQNFSFIIPRAQRKDIFLEGDDTSDKLVDYDLEHLGCPFKRLKNEPFKPVIDLYDGELFLEEVDANYVLWEQQGRAGFEYSATMKENFRSCFEDRPSEPVIPDNLNQAYEIMNSSSVSHIVWTECDDGVFIFTLTVIDPEFSFCNLTVEFAVQVICARSLFQELPTFVTLGSCCLTITVLLFSAYYITTFFST
ncbi:cation channel sperm-associated protein subunit epsilon-like isoform X2 [Acropora millepora]|uniref:cation channel sperm-associated protein subunit epsilon-like isoform X2 n=1 Tax=Acropora millepora TaxID=45264 RepID=UPI001CF12618|nr:cation channel sperm-associated protein subunit epsilon-like isoform X2 [Acropora millepora]